MPQPRAEEEASPLEKRLVETPAVIAHWSGSAANGSQPAKGRLSTKRSVGSAERAYHGTQTPRIS